MVLSTLHLDGDRSPGIFLLSERAPLSAEPE